MPRGTARRPESKSAGRGEETSYIGGGGHHIYGQLGLNLGRLPLDWIIHRSMFVLAVSACMPMSRLIIGHLCTTVNNNGSSTVERWLCFFLPPQRPAEASRISSECHEAHSAPRARSKQDVAGHHTCPCQEHSAGVT
jgi:hypothetical protein